MTTAQRALEAVLFDAHGTLIETRESVGATYGRLAREHGVDLPDWRIDDAFRRILGRMPERFEEGAGREELRAHERAWWRQVLRGTFLATDQTVHFEDFDAFFDAVYRHYAGAGAWRLRPGAREALHALRALGLRTAIVSNFDERLPDILEAIDIYEFFDFLAIPSICLARKPGRALFEAALEGLGVPASAAAYVGDDAPGDLEGAREAGLWALDAGTLPSLSALPDRLRTEATLSSPATPETTEPPETTAAETRGGGRGSPSEPRP